MKKLLAFAFVLSSLNIAFADDCANLYDEAVHVEVECLNYDNNLSREIIAVEELYESFRRLPYKNEREIAAMNGLRKKADYLRTKGYDERDARCDKRWEVSAIYLAVCSIPLQCQKNSKNQYDLKVFSPTKKSHTMHTYPTHYECLVRKKKIETASKE